MKLMKSADRIAGTLFLISAVPVLLAWAMLLLVGHQSNLSLMASAFTQAEYVFSAKNPDRLWFVWFALLPLICAALGASYLLGLANNRTLAVALFAASIVLSGATFFLCDWTIAAFVTLPIYWGLRCVRRI
jgi:hypothetical protein